jgi:hypothetical protein
MLLAVAAVLSSMFWFPEPADVDPQATAFLAIERDYLASPWTLSKIAMTALIPVWFIACAWVFCRRSWVGGFILISAGTLLCNERRVSRRITGR